MLVYNYKSFLLGLSLTVLFFSCKKEKIYVYEVNDVEISQPGVEKPNLKTNTQFISIAFTDLFGSTVSQDQLSDLEMVYVSFADKSVIEDLIIRTFLNETGNTLPSQTEMDADISLFVTNAYKKIYTRLPNEYELWYLVDKINEEGNITTELFYYALLTSNEYRQY
jgi:hypothetical protein